MNRYLYIIIVLTFVTLSCPGQIQNHKKIIQSFVNQLSSEADVMSFSHFYNQGMLYTSQEYSEFENKSEIDTIYNIILEAIREDVFENNQPLGNLEILTIAESKLKKQYVERLEIPDNCECFAYILYSNTNIITRFLMRDNKIASFSIISKGEESFFVLF